jgi:hypothetical protein
VSPIFKRPDVEGCPERLMFSVLVITWVGFVNLIKVFWIYRN